MVPHYCLGDIGYMYGSHSAYKAMPFEGNFMFCDRICTNISFSTKYSLPALLQQTSDTGAFGMLVQPMPVPVF